MNYIAPNTFVSASHWNDIFQTADNMLTKYCGGVSPLMVDASQIAATSNGLYAIDYQYDRAFFIGWTPVNMNSASLHPLAWNLFGYGASSPYWANVVTTQKAMCYREYNHSAITTLVNSCAVTGSPQLGCIRLVKPTWASWESSIYPEGFGIFGSQDYIMSTGANPTSSIVDNLLDCSLGVIKYNYGTSSYNVTFNDITTAEHAQPLKPIDVFVMGSLTWDNTNWDKYSLIRFHNMGRSTITITMAVSNSFYLQPAGSRCVRKNKSSGAWEAQGNYFWWMEPGDGRYMGLQETNAPFTTVAGGANIYQPGIVADILNQALGVGWVGNINSNDNGNTSTLAPFPLDPSKMWDYSTIINNANYQAQTNDGEVTPPSGGYMAPLSFNSMLGDLCCNKGNYLIFVSNFATSGSGGYTIQPFKGFSTLQHDINSSSFCISNSIHIRNAAMTDANSTYNNASTVQTLEIYCTSSTAPAFVDLSSNFSSFLNYQNGPKAQGGASQYCIQIGPDTGSNPSSVLMPYFQFTAPLVQARQAYDINYGLTGSFTQWDTQITIKGFTAMNTVQDVVNWITTIENSGSQQLNPFNFQLYSTTFGPALTWQEIWPVKAGFMTNTLQNGVPTVIYTNYAYIDNCNAIQVVLDVANDRFYVTRCVYLQNALAPMPIPNVVAPNIFYPTFPPNQLGFNAGGGGTVASPNSKFIKWNFPRTNQYYSYGRYYLMDTASAPMMPNWYVYNNNSNYTRTKYISTLIGGSGTEWWKDTLSQSPSIWDNTVSFYEVSSSASVFNNINVDYPNGFTTYTNGIQPQLFPKNGISFMHQFDDETDAFGPLSTWLTGSTYFNWQIAPDLAAGGAVHGGSIAGDTLVNAILNNGPAISNQDTPNVLGCSCEQFNALASFVNAMPTHSYWVAQNGLPQSFDFITDWASGGSAISFPVYNAPQGGVEMYNFAVWPRDACYIWYPSQTDVTYYISTVFPSATIHTVTGNSVSPRTINYLDFHDVAAIYADYGMPFTVDRIAYPVSWQADTSLSTGGYYYTDTGGAYLAVDPNTLDATVVADVGSPCADASSNLSGGPLLGPTGSNVAAVVPTALAVTRVGCLDACLSITPRNFFYTDGVSYYFNSTNESGGSGQTSVVPGNSGSYVYNVTSNVAYGYVKLTPLNT